MKGRHADYRQPSTSDPQCVYCTRPIAFRIAIASRDPLVSLACIAQYNGLEQVTWTVADMQREAPGGSRLSYDDFYKH